MDNLRRIIQQIMSSQSLGFYMYVRNYPSHAHFKQSVQKTCEFKTLFNWLLVHESAEEMLREFNSVQAAAFWSLIAFTYVY